VLQYQWLGFEIGAGHINAQLLGFITARNDAAIVVAEYNYGSKFQIGLKQPFAGAVKIITINNPFHGVFFF
jgi:hypothetical protein